MPKYKMIKYPRTPHLEGSRLQKGDEDLKQVPFSEIRGKMIAVEEKCDGANSAISFDQNGDLLLQSRGHYLIGGVREKHFNLFKQWATVHQSAFFEVLGTRYVLYGEWVFAKHSVFYNALNHYFLEFDILDRETGLFLDTPSRHSLLAGLPIISVPVLHRRSFDKKEDLIRLIGPSNYIREGHLERLADLALQDGLDPNAVLAETDPTNIMEGLYLKIEENGSVAGRLKYVRPSFLQQVLESGTHWLSRPIIPNQLAYPVEEIFAPSLPDSAKTITGDFS
ncbi:MAG: RNA ligase family protein [Planctomycetia bacterium]|nr:RNA ligase family protein [Planctomycetia bacterium]